MSNKIKYLSVISILVLSLLVLPFTVSASTNILSFDIPQNRPSSINGNAYMEIITTNDNVHYDSFVIVYNCNYSNNTEINTVSFHPVLNQYSITVTVLPISDGVDFLTVSSYYMSDAGVQSYKSYEITNTYATVNHTFTKKIVGVHYYGFTIDDDSYTYSTQPFVINYASDIFILENLYDIVLNQNNIIQKLDKIYSKIPSIQWQDVVGIFDILDNMYSFLSTNWQDIDSIKSSTEDIYNYISEYFYYLEELQFIESSLNEISSINQTLQDLTADTFMYLDDMLQSIYTIDQNLYDLTADTYWQLGQIEEIISEFYNSDNYYEDENEPPAEIAPPRDDSTIQEIEAAEQEALGGLTQEEVKELADEALDPTSKAEEIGATEINVNNIAVANNLFTDMFGVLGGSWSTFFLLNLSVAFAAFLIGRRY